MHPEFWIGLWYGAIGVGLLWCIFESWRCNKSVQAWLASEQERIDREVADGVSESSQQTVHPADADGKVAVATAIAMHEAQTVMRTNRDGSTQ